MSNKNLSDFIEAANELLALNEMDRELSAREIALSSHGERLVSERASLNGKIASAKAKVKNLAAALN